MKPTTVTVNAAARRLGTRVDSIYKLLYAGFLTGWRVDGRWAISAASVEEYAVKPSRQARAVNQDTSLVAANA
jgi:excisionase family DNA binding protein